MAVAGADRSAEPLCDRPVDPQVAGRRAAVPVVVDEGVVQGEDRGVDDAPDVAGVGACAAVWPLTGW